MSTPLVPIVIEKNVAKHVQVCEFESLSWNDLKYLTTHSTHFNYGHVGGATCKCEMLGPSVLKVAWQSNKYDQAKK